MHSHSRAVVVHRFGGPEVLETVQLALPVPGSGAVRIRVEATAVNPVDAATRAGILTEAGVAPPREVLGIGWDVAGTIEAVGTGVAGLHVGDAVIGLRDRIGAPRGTYADHVVLDADAVTLAPAGHSAVAASTLPLNGLTASQGLDLMDLPPGATVLITGASGAVGGYAVALAHTRKLRVIAQGRESDEALLRSWGADAVLARGDDLGDRVRAIVPGGVDGALDTALLGADALDAVRGGGEFVSVVGGTAPIPLRGIRVRNVWVRADATRLAELVTLVEDGTLHLRVAATLPLADAADAHTRLAAGGLQGRLVLVP